MKITKEKELLLWCKKTKLFSSVDVKRWGLNHAYTRSDRTVRDFVRRGIVKRISDHESVLRGLVKNGQARIAWYEVG